MSEARLTHAPVQLLGCSSPALEGNDLTVPMRFSNGIVPITSSREMFVSMAMKILKLAGEAPKHQGKKRGPQMSAERLAQYMLAEATCGKRKVSRRFVSDQAICDALGVSYYGFKMWQHRRRQPRDSSYNPG